MGADPTIRLRHETAQVTYSYGIPSLQYLLEFTSEYGIPESLHPELPGPEEPIVEFSEGKVGVYTKFFEFANFHMDLFNLISTPNPTKVKTGTRPRAAHEVSLLTVTASRVIDMEETTLASGSSGTPSALEKLPSLGCAAWSWDKTQDEANAYYLIDRIAEAWNPIKDGRHSFLTDLCFNSGIEKQVSQKYPIQEVLL
ncbi:hypothetical protein Tco_0190361 [Tanacetum coccineum]